MIRIGKIVATHGLKGTVIFTHLLPGAAWLSAEVPLFVELRKGSRIPFFITSFKEAGDDAYHLLLEETDTVEKARQLVGRFVFVEDRWIEGKAPAHSPLLWIGFRMQDLQGQDLGEVEDVYETPAQWLGQLRHQGREVLVPLIPEMIREVRIETRTIIVDLPDGLLDI